MSEAELNQAFELVESNAELAHFHGPKSEALICAAEKALKIEFPPTYREFLQRYGCGNFDGEEIYGLIDENFKHSSVPNGIWLTLKERDASLPEYLVIVYSTGAGSYYCLDLSAMSSDGECPVVEFHPGFSKSGDRMEIVAADFGALFISLIHDVLGDPL